MTKSDLMAKLTAALGASVAGDEILKEVFADGEEISEEGLEERLRALNALSADYQKDGNEEMLDLTNKKIVLVQKAVDLLKED